MKDTSTGSRIKAVLAKDLVMRRFSLGGPKIMVRYLSSNAERIGGPQTLSRQIAHKGNNLYDGRRLSLAHAAKTQRLPRNSTITQRHVLNVDPDFRKVPISIISDYLGDSRQMKSRVLGSAAAQSTFTATFAINHVDTGASWGK